MVFYPRLIFYGIYVFTMNGLLPAKNVSVQLFISNFSTGLRVLHNVVNLSLIFWELKQQIV